MRSINSRKLVIPVLLSGIIISGAVGLSEPLKLSNQSGIFSSSRLGVNAPPELTFSTYSETGLTKNTYDYLGEEFVGALELSTESLRANTKSTAVGPPDIGAKWIGANKWMHGVNFGGETYNGSIAKGVNFFGSSVLPEDYIKIELRFTSNTSEWSFAQTFLRKTGAGNYNAAGVGLFPGSTWDVSDTLNPRQLNICFVEWDDGVGPNPVPDSLWNPNADGSVLGKREYLFIMNSSYDGTGLTYAATNILNDNPDVLYAWWPKVTVGSTFLESVPATLEITPYYVTSFQATKGDGQINLSWLSADPSVSKFKLYLSTSSPASSVVDSVDGSTTSYLHTGLTNGITYYTRVESYVEVPSAGCCDIPGDADNNGAVEISDAIRIVRYVFTDGDAPPCLLEGDADGGGDVNVGDATFLVKFIFTEGAIPQCGAAPDVDSLLGESPELAVKPEAQSSGLTLVGTWNSRSTYGDSWGYTDSLGNEYALLCARNQGVSIIDIGSPTPIEVGFMPSISTFKDAKDVKVYQNYAIIVKEQEPIQIFDLSDVTAPAQVSTITLPGGSGGAHNCLVDGDYLYIVGDHSNGGLEIYDISNPASPLKVGDFQDFYYHDIAIRNDTLYACGISGDGIDILDISNKATPFRIGQFNYAGSGAHNVEISSDGNHVYVGDETGSSGQHTRIFDVSNLGSVSKTADIIVDPSASTHNAYLKGNNLYIAHYTEGLRVWDVSNSAAPFEIAHYDTYLPGGYGYNGCWNVYPYFASGKIILSDLQSGLFVLTLDP